MPRYSLHLPDSESLSFVLSKVLNENGFVEGNIKVLDRQPNIYSSTYPSEVVTCLLPNGHTLQIFCKYGSLEYFDPRGDIYYEAIVYRNILQPLPVSSPVFYGFHAGEKESGKWLFLEYIDRAIRVSKAEGADPMIQAASWIGRFHAATEINLSHASTAFLVSCDVDHYLGLTRRVLLLTDHLHHRFAWLSRICEQFDRMATLLVPNKRTVIHGEYYPKNILYQEGVVRPVDWQTAAIAAGEIDLASLTHNWPAEIVYECEREYQRTRWPEHGNEDFRQVLGVARLYILIRHLGSHEEWKRGHRYMPWYFEKLKNEGERLGLL